MTDSHEPKRYTTSKSAVLFTSERMPSIEPHFGKLMFHALDATTLLCVYAAGVAEPDHLLSGMFLFCAACIIGLGLVMKRMNRNKLFGEYKRWHDACRDEAQRHGAVLNPSVMEKLS